MSDYVQVTCKYCYKTTSFSLEAVQSEIKRLRTYNFEILPCQHCNRKFSKMDFEKALGLGRLEDIGKSLSESIANGSIDVSILPDDTKTALEEQLKKEAEAKLAEQLKKEEEIKKMQAGEPFDEKIVGPVEMEEGTPQDRRCVRVLKKEGELYAYTFNAIDYVVTNVWEILRSIGHAIWDIIKKINWCIVCSALRIGYFIGYIGLIIYGLVATFILHEAIFNNNYLDFLKQFQNCTLPYHIWTMTIILICIIPLGLQLSWAFSTPDSRWAKVIKKRADEIIK